MHPFVLKLRHGADLTSDDECTLVKLAEPGSSFGKGADIYPDGAAPHAIAVISDGWACRYKLLQNGKRQIISIFLPGDLCEPFGVLPRVVDHALGAISTVQVARVPIGSLRSAWQASPGIEEALWWDTLLCEAIAREHVISLGRRSATERLGHLFCELYLRLEMIGLADNLTYNLPLTQTDLGDLTGLSLVHVNRSLKDMRESGLVALYGRKIIIKDFDGLSDLAFFDPTYLRIKGRGRG